MENVHAMEKSSFSQVLTEETCVSLICKYRGYLSTSGLSFGHRCFPVDISNRNEDFSKTVDFGKIHVFLAKSLDFGKKGVPHWILILEWKLKVSFTTFKSKSTKICKFSPKSTVFGRILCFWQNLWFLGLKTMDFSIKYTQNLWILPKSMDFQKLESWDLGLWSSKVFSFSNERPMIAPHTVNCNELKEGATS